jgi:hypothetical protein
VAIAAILSLTVPVLVAEGRTGFRATGRSWRLAHRAPRPVDLLFVATQIVTALVSYGGQIAIQHVVNGAAQRLAVGLEGLVIGVVTTTANRRGHRIRVRGAPGADRRGNPGWAPLGYATHPVPGFGR